MGKSLIIKGADFSANGIPVSILLGTVTKTNVQDTAVNFDFKYSLIEAMNPSKSSVKLLVTCENASVNQTLNGVTLLLKVNISGFPTIASAVWGNPIEINIPPIENPSSNLSLMFQTGSTYSGLSNKEFKVTVSE